MRMFLAFLCSAIGFTVQWREQWLPARPSPESLIPEYPGSWFHAMKNITTEWVRADPEWFGKAFSFAILVQFVAIVMLLF
jgi:hypothetical protein